MTIRTELNENDVEGLDDHLSICYVHCQAAVVTCPNRSLHDGILNCEASCDFFNLGQVSICHHLMRTNTSSDRSHVSAGKCSGNASGLF